ncbi:hypothetical protein HHI36_009028 [Cryptolaemus montrouzieri]|uniref:Transcription factor CBF/NF-Y/archaeal histone domain-containing protein n=1 Tax=Cryptolaemus montrouzieri TaxID=559131 RepID=A0ABD2MU21_9CUCU
MSRIKTIMRSDPDCNIISQDAVYLVTKATEMFIEFLGKEAAKTTINTKRKTVMKRDVDSAIDQVSHLCFLEGALEWQ